MCGRRTAALLSSAPLPPYIPARAGRVLHARRAADAGAVPRAAHPAPRRQGAARGQQPAAAAGSAGRAAAARRRRQAHLAAGAGAAPGAAPPSCSAAAPWRGSWRAGSATLLCNAHATARWTATALFAHPTHPPHPNPPTPPQSIIIIPRKKTAGQLHAAHRGGRRATQGHRCDRGGGAVALGERGQAGGDWRRPGDGPQRRRAAGRLSGIPRRALAGRGARRLPTRFTPRGAPRLALSDPILSAPFPRLWPGGVL